MDNVRKSKSEDSREIFIREILLKKSEIEAVIRNLKENRRREEQDNISFRSFEEIDRADNEISAQQYYSFLERKYSDLKRIDKLLDKIYQDEDFGWCEECGERISKERLSVVPDATRCISCQREYEKMESRRGSNQKKYKNSSGGIDLDDEETEDNQELKTFIGTIDKDSVSLEDWDEIDLGGNHDDTEVSSSSDIDNGNGPES